MGYSSMLVDQGWRVKAADMGFGWYSSAAQLLYSQQKRRTNLIYCGTRCAGFKIRSKSWLESPLQHPPMFQLTALLSDKVALCYAMLMVLDRPIPPALASQCNMMVCFVLARVLGV